MHGRNVEDKGLALILTSITYFEPGTPRTRSKERFTLFHEVWRGNTGFNLIFTGMEENVRRG